MTIKRTDYECDQCHRLVTVNGDDLPDGWVIQQIATNQMYIEGGSYLFHLCSKECQAALLERLGVARDRTRNAN